MCSAIDKSGYYKPINNWDQTYRLYKELSYSADVLRGASEAISVGIGTAVKMVQTLNYH